MTHHRKTLKQRLYTFMQLDRKLHEHLDQRAVRLYSNVKAGYSSRNPRLLIPASIGIAYEGVVGKDVLRQFTRAFPIAEVYRAADNASVYMLYGIGTKRNKPEMRRKIARWMRYAPAFTPLPAGERLYEGDRRYYLVKDGAVTQIPDLTGVWCHGPPPPRQNLRVWADGDGMQFRSYQNYTKRCRLFANRLRGELVDAFHAELRLTQNPQYAWYHVHFAVARTMKGVGIQICTPPIGTQHGRCLDVQIRMYDDAEARRFHHVDGDYGIKNCHFYALEHGKKWSDVMRWKCARDAINGIKEWIIGDIYIPGPG